MLKDPGVILHTMDHFKRRPALEPELTYLQSDVHLQEHRRWEDGNEIGVSLAEETPC